MEPTTFIGFILSIALWWLIGAERELPWWGAKIWWSTGFWWIRSYASIALLGAIGVWLDSLHPGTYFWTLFWAICSTLLIVASYIYSSFQKGKIGVTSEYAGLITYTIGVIAMWGYYSTAVILSILILLLLSSKEYFSRLKTRFSREELGDSLKFSVIALVILPLLPKDKYSIADMINWFYQWGIHWTHPVLQVDFFSPYGIWFFVVVMTGVEYTGFILSKMIGDKGGIIASGIIGGLISSTATTVAMTRKSREYPEHRNSYVVATLLSSCVMFLRVLIVATYIYFAMLEDIWIPALVMFFGLIGTAWYYYLQSRHEVMPITKDEKERKYESPFQMIPALQFAGLIILIKFISELWKIYQDIIPLEVSSYFIGLISGLADVDGVNYIYASGAKIGEIPLGIATTTVIIAVISNNLVKASLAYRFWESGFGKKVLAGFGMSIALWLLSLILLHGF